MKLEKLLWKGYAALNKRRKAKENTPKMFKALDNIRRQSGYIK